MCYITCKHCETKGNDNNHKCSECSDAFPYSFKNGTKCLDDCSKENLFADMKTKICYNDCKENINERICNYKNICLSKNDKPKNYILDESNNFVSLCNPKTEYEFNNECYKNCPDNTKIDQSIKNKNICKCKNLYFLEGENEICINSNICPNNYPSLKINTKECTNCTVKYKDECFLSCPENTCITQINENLAICVDKLDETKIIGGICFDDFITILDNVEQVENNNNIVINNFPGVTINIYENGINIDEIKDKYPNLTFINLEECGKELKRFYKLSDDEKLYIISVDKLTKISYKVINDYDFEIYLKNGSEIKYLNVCKNLPISFSSSIIKKDLAHFKEAEIFNSQGYDIYDFSSKFYNDKCTAAFINGNDIIIKDRIEDIYPYNISFCSFGCELINIELESKRVNCSCNISTKDENESFHNNEIQLNDIQSNDNNFINYLLDRINYKIFNRSKITTKSKIKHFINNIGLILGMIYTLFNLVCFFIFYFIFIPKIETQILNLTPGNKNTNNNNINFPPKKDKNKFKICKIIRIKKGKNKINKSLSRLGLNDDISEKKIKEKIKIKNKKIKAKESPSPLRKFNTIKDRNKKISNKNNYNKKEIEEEDYNNLPFTQAIKFDKRNFFMIYISILKMKIEIISILFYPEKFTHISLTLSLYLFEFLLSYFMNALLYSDDIVSQKYHN